MQHNNKKYCYGSFDNEEDAAIKVNLICDKCEIKHKNPTIKMKLDVIQHSIHSLYVLRQTERNRDLGLESKARTQTNIVSRLFAL